MGPTFGVQMVIYRQLVLSGGPLLGCPDISRSNPAAPLALHWLKIWRLVIHVIVRAFQLAVILIKWLALPGLWQSSTKGIPKWLSWTKSICNCQGHHLMPYVRPCVTALYQTNGSSAEMSLGINLFAVCSAMPTTFQWLSLLAMHIPNIYYLQQNPSHHII